MPTATLTRPRLVHRQVATGATYWGPGDMYRFLVTGEETGGAYFAMEALVPPGGGPPPHVHRNEDETFYVVEGEVDFLLGAVARIVHDAFARIHDHHRFPRDFPTLEAAQALVSAFIAQPSIWGVVAELEGRIVGSNFLDERGPIAGVGPITVDPDAQQGGVGRRLMQAVLEHAADAAGIRLLQDAFNMRSLALYASLGFEVEEPVALIGGTLRHASAPGLEVRPLTARDLDACERLHLAVHGFERSRQLREALDGPLDPYVAVRDGRVVGYLTSVTFFAAAHGVAETERDMAELIVGALAATDAPASLLLPTRQHELFRACLAAGLRLLKPMTYMVVGECREPRGAWIPSVLY